MKFKKFLSDQDILAEQRNNIVILITEAESTVTKLKTLYDTASMIQNLEIASIFTEIKSFMKSSTKNMKISQLQSWGFDIVKDLEKNIKVLLTIKKTMQTPYLNSLITQYSKLINNIKDHVKTKKDEYDLVTP